MPLGASWKLTVMPYCLVILWWQCSMASVIGIRTDFRQGGDTAHSSVNAMIEGSVVGIAHDIEGVLKFLEKLA